MKLVGVQPNFTASWLSGAAYGCRLCDSPGISLYISAVCHNTCPIVGMFINCLHVNGFYFFFFAYHLVGLIASMQRRERKPAHHKENKQHSNNLPRKSHLNSWLKGNLYAKYRRGREVLPSPLITSVIKLPYLKLGYISWTLKCLYLLKGGSRDSGLGARGEKLERGCSR